MKDNTEEALSDLFGDKVKVLDNKLVIMVGLPGSGKSTYIQNNLSYFKVVCLDEIRQEWFGNASIQYKGYEVYLEGMKRIKQALEQGLNVVYDATNINASTRKKIIKQFNTFPIECVYVKTNYNNCAKRNANRERKVPEEVISKMYNRLQEPTKEEGFCDIKIFEND